MKLPANWQAIHAAALAEELLASLPNGSLRIECLHCLIAASLQMLWGNFWKNRNPLETLGPLHWRVRQLDYKCLMEVSDTEVEACRELFQPGHDLAIIAPPRCENALRGAVREILGIESHFVISLEWVLSFRAIDFAVHTGRGPAEFMKDWLTRYNSNVLSDGRPECLLVDLD